jgi:hypothetical protein
MTTPACNGQPAQPAFGPDNPSPTAELTALAADLRRIADRVDDLDTRCDQLTSAVKTTGAALRAETAAQFAEHSEQVQTLLDTLTAQHATEALDWPAMTFDQAAAAWATLAHWISDTLVPWYEITRDQLPDCWALHRPAVLHLSWLRQTYQDAHRPGAAPRLAADWHTRWLPAALRAVREAIPSRGMRTCGPGQHLVTGADRARQQPLRTAPPTAPSIAHNDQLAERLHWQGFYDVAVAADLSVR